MGFFTDVGSGLGKIAGGVIGGTVAAVGDIVGSKTLKEIGESACNVTAQTGKALGRFTDGAVKCVGGVISDDKYKMKTGASEMGNVASETVTNLGKGLVHTAELGFEGIGAVITGDNKKAVEVGKTFAKAAAVGVLSFGVLDAVDGLIDGSILDADHDGVPDFLEDDDVVRYVENPNMHHVSPHWRELSDGTKIWVDGDGNSAVDTFNGWYQHNPDYKA